MKVLQVSTLCTLAIGHVGQCKHDHPQQLELIRCSLSSAALGIRDEPNFHLKYCMNSRLGEGTACFSCENSPEWTPDGGLAEFVEWHSH